MEYIVGIGEYIITDKVDSKIITYALGSCVAVVFYSKSNHISAMMHIVLPKKLGNTKNNNKKVYYADLGLEIVIDELKTKYKCDINKMKVYLFGGADSVKLNDRFNVGRRNLDEIKKILETKKIKYNDNEVGGNVSRTICLLTNTGEVSIQYQKIII